MFSDKITKEQYKELDFVEWVIFLNNHCRERSYVMGLMEVDVNDAVEPIVIEAGQEVRVRVTSVRTGDDKNGKPYVMPVFEVPDEPNAKDFSDFMYSPDKGKLSAKELAKAKWKMKTFFDATGFDNSRPFDPEDDWIGLEGWVIVGVSKSEEYGEQNTIRKYLSKR